jgi:hypothetical protein
MNRPHLGADPLKPPGAAATAGNGMTGDPLLDAAYAKAEPAGEAAGIPVGPEEVTAGLVGIFAAIAWMRGPHWAVEPDECALVAPPLARELSKPDTTLAAWLAKHGDAALIVLGLGVLIVPRAYVEVQVLKARRDQLRAGPRYEETDATTAYPGWDAYAAAGYGPGAAAAPPPPLPEPGLSAAGEGAGAVPSDPRAVASSVAAIIG